MLTTANVGQASRLPSAVGATLFGRCAARAGETPALRYGRTTNGAADLRFARAEYVASGKSACVMPLTRIV